MGGFDIPSNTFEFFAFALGEKSFPSLLVGAQVLIRRLCMILLVSVEVTRAFTQCLCKRKCPLEGFVYFSGSDTKKRAFTQCLCKRKCSLEAFACVSGRDTSLQCLSTRKCSLEEC